MEEAEFTCYFPVDSAAVGRGLYLTTTGSETIPPGATDYPRQKHPSMYGFTWNQGRVLPSVLLMECQAGGGVVEFVRGDSRVVQAGEVIVVPPNIWHRYRPLRETGWQARWVKLAGSAIAGYVAAGMLSNQAQVTRPVAPTVFRVLFDHLIQETRAAPTANPATWALKALALFGLCAAVPEPVASGSSTAGITGDSLVDEVIRHIWNHSHRVLDVPMLATMTGVSRRTLETRFHHHRGGSVLEEINRARLERAVELLANTSLRMADIVSLSGFGSAEAMRKTFWKFRGSKPSDVRQR